MQIVTAQLCANVKWWMRANVAAAILAPATPPVIVEMENSHKLIALVALALVAEGGLLYNAYMSWGGGMPDGIATLNVFFKDVILTVVGFLAGSSIPSDKTR